MNIAWQKFPLYESIAAPVAEQRIADLYRTYGPAIFARCRRILADSAAAEDATQETFIRVQRHLARAPDGREALAWIYRIATNYCLNEVRNRKVRATPTETLPEWCAEPGAVERLLVETDLVRRLVMQAPEKLRVVAWLYHVDGLEQAELAKVLDVSRRTVVTRLADFEKFTRRFVEREAA